MPAILELIPYRRRDGTVFRDMKMHPYVAGHGFACCRVDIRGSGDSEGLLTDEYTELEQEDACEIIAWLGRLHSRPGFQASLTKGSYIYGA